MKLDSKTVISSNNNNTIREATRKADEKNPNVQQVFNVSDPNICVNMRNDSKQR